MLNGTYAAIFCDLDGCLISGDRVLPGALEFVEQAGTRLFILSNNSTDTPETMSRRLSGMGIEVPATRILLAGAAAVERIAAAYPDTRVALYGSAALKRYAEELSLTIDFDAPEVILLTRDITFSYEKLAMILHQTANGARLVVSNPDHSHPGPDGTPVPETGALLEAIIACQPHQPFETVGKPEAPLFDAALSKAGVDAGDAILIGDNPDTDGVGADRAGMAFRQVEPGALSAGLLALTARPDSCAPLEASRCGEER